MKLFGFHFGQLFFCTYSRHVFIGSLSTQKALAILFNLDVEDSITCTANTIDLVHVPTSDPRLSTTNSSLKKCNGVSKDIDVITVNCQGRARLRYHVHCADCG